MLRKFLFDTVLIVRKDLQIEGKSREILYTMGFSAALVVLVFSFSFANATLAAQGPLTAAGVLWAGTLLTGTVALARVFDRERENETIRTLFLSPVSRSAIYLGKLLATAILMYIVELFLLLLVGVLFAATVTVHLPLLLAIMWLGTLGFAAAGVVFSGALLRSKSRDALLGALLFPIVIPVLLAASRATACLFDPLSPDLNPAYFWAKFLIATDALFIVLGVWIFEPVVLGD